MPDPDRPVALVTGASSGIGEATAKLLAGAGYTVMVTARRADRLEALVGEIEQAGGHARAFVCDITDPGSVHSMVDEVLAHSNRLDALINNAGVMPLETIDSASLDNWRLMVDVNINGVLSATHAALPHFVSRGAGHIVNISSTAGRRVFPRGAVYCGTKFFVHAFSEGMRGELASNGIRVTIVAPGLVRTELHSHIPDPDARERLKGADFEWLHPEDVGRAVVYALEQPEHVSVNEVLVRPSRQEN